jgi:4-amino-4-deoxy-L-arabinose transferase-like glycosyltransferase
MSRWLSGRPGHYALLLATGALLFLPSLGTPSLWDIDEGHNAEAAREMLESGNWIVPTFNFRLRVDKPALLYWLQMATYEVLGISEFAARLPSALAALAALLLVYELGRCMFTASTALLAGLILASALLFCGAAQFANPDALLNAFTLLTLFFFWRGFSRDWQGWFIAAGISAGLAVLAKGPVGFVLPALVVGAVLLLTGRLRILWNPRLLLGLVAYGFIAFPWYIWVAVDTKADFLRGFFLTHNVNRFLSPMENHGGPFYYYAVVLLVGFAPWSAFLGLTVWSSLQEWRTSRQADQANTQSARARPEVAHLFLWCWIGAYVLFFTLGSTKLPNYILPIYPAVALLTARFLDRWRTGELAVPAWLLCVGLGCTALVGVVAVLGLLIAGGTIPLAALKQRHFDGLAAWALIGSFPIVGATSGWWLFEKQRRTAAVSLLSASAILFAVGLSAAIANALDAYKAPRPLAQAVLAAIPEPEVRVGCFEYYQPSLVFYCRREVVRFASADHALEFLRWPVPAYLFIPEGTWETLQSSARGPAHIIGRHYDLYRGYHVVVVTNRVKAHSP